MTKRTLEKIRVKTRRNDGERERTVRMGSKMNPARVKLTGLKPSKFDENPMKRNNFWEYFNSVINTSEAICKVGKFQYLVSLLEGKARMATKYFPRNEKTYKQAIPKLVERFGSEELRH